MTIFKILLRYFRLPKSNQLIMTISNKTFGKKLSIVILFLFINNLSKAQWNSSFDFSNNYNYENNIGLLYANNDYKTQGVKEVTTKFIHSKTNQLNTQEIYTIDKNGVGYFYKKYNKKGKIYLTRTYHLIDTARYDSMETAYRKDTFSSIYIFNDSKKIIELQYFNNKHEKYWTFKYTYNDKNKLASSTSLNKKDKQYFRNEFYYYDNGSIKETLYYNNKNKLKKIYSYACEPTGEVTKKVTQQNICKKRTYNSDSTFVEIFEGHDNKGHSSRRIVKYSKDSFPLEQLYYNHKDQEIKRYVSEYNDGKTINYQYYYKGKLKRAYHYTYNAKGLIESYQSINNKGKIKNNNVYEYSYF